MLSISEDHGFRSLSRKCTKIISEQCKSMSMSVSVSEWVGGGAWQCVFAYQEAMLRVISRAEIDDLSR